MFYIKIKNKKQQEICLIATLSILIASTSCNKINDINEKNNLSETEDKNDPTNIIYYNAQTLINNNEEKTIDSIENRITTASKENKRKSKKFNNNDRNINIAEKVAELNSITEPRNKKKKIDPKIFKISPEILEYLKTTNRDGLISGEWLEKTDKYEEIRKILPKAYEIHRITQTKSAYLDSYFSREQNRIEDIINQLEIEEKKDDYKKNNSKKLYLLKKLETILTMRKKKNIFSSDTELRYVGDEGFSYEKARESYSELRRVIEKMEENEITDCTFDERYELNLKKIRNYREEFRTLQNLIGGYIPKKAEDLYSIKNINPDSLIASLRKNRINLNSDDIKHLYSLQEIIKQMKNLDKGKIENIDNHLNSLNKESYELIKNLINKVNLPKRSKWSNSAKFLQLLKLVYLYSITMVSSNEIKPSGESLNLDVYDAILEEDEDDEQI